MFENFQSHSGTGKEKFCYIIFFVIGINPDAGKPGKSPEIAIKESCSLGKHRMLLSCTLL
jgi:hypothetical protein